MTAEEFEARIVNWARSRADVVALVQIGSRVQAGGEIDAWSDWDYHLIVRNAGSYKKPDWVEQIAPCWNAHADTTERGVVKISAVFAGGWEADFVPLAAWQMKLVYWAMGRPHLAFAIPRILKRGISDTQLVVGPGYRVVLGGNEWEARLSALQVQWPKAAMTFPEFSDRVNGFWRHAVWVHKKIMRGELRAALRWMHRELVERRWLLLEEEAKLAGRAARPEARRAEIWLDAKRQAQTATGSEVARKALAQALLAEIDLFEEVSRSVATGHGFTLPDHTALSAWIRAELAPLAESV